jgi:hypothetical protein
MDRHLATNIRSKLTGYGLFKTAQIDRVIAALRGTRMAAKTRVKVFFKRCTCQEYLVEGIWRTRAGRFHAVIEVHTPEKVEPDEWTACDDGCIHFPSGLTMLGDCYLKD